MRRSESADAGARPASDRSFGRVGAVDASRGSDLVAPGTTVRCHRHLLLPRLLSTGSAAHSRRQRWQPVRPTGPRGCSSISRYPIVASPGGARKRSTPRCTASSARPRDCRPAASLRRTNCCAHTGFVSPPTGSSRMVCCGPISGGVEPVWCKQPAHGTDPGQRGCLVAPTPSLRKRVRGARRGAPPHVPSC